MSHPLSEMMDTTMEKIRSMVDVNTVVGDPITTPNGVTIIGDTCLEAHVPATASQMYGSNVYNFIEHFTKDGEFHVDMEDPIMKSCIVARGGQITDERFM